jgi:DHA1 family bicyclomycin/chloramphenicol resistance-like MFS transporter
MLPALDRIRDDLAVTGANDQQLVVSTYMLGFGLGQLIHGPLSDRFGRRPVLFAGLGLFLAASLAAVWAPTLGALLAARFVQGFANAAPRVMSVAVTRDVYGGRRMAEVMSLVMMAFIIVPVLAPSLGAVFLMFGSWRLIFAFLAAAALALLVWAALRLPETRAPSARQPLSAAWLLGAARETLGTRQTLGYLVATGFLFSCLLAYISSAQQIFTEVYPTGGWFPVIFGAVAIGIAAASLLNSRLVTTLGMRRVSHVALIGFLAAGGLLAALSLGLGRPPLAAAIALFAVALFCFGLIMPNFNALAMEPMGRIAGTAASVIGALTTVMAVVIGGWVGQHYDGTILPLALSFALMPALSLAAVLVTERGRLFRSAPPGAP